MLVGAQRSLGPEWVAHHTEFHAALVGASGSKRLLTLHHALYEQSERYRAVSVHTSDSRDVNSEHEASMGAALARDPETLIDLMTKHLRRTTSMLLDAARKSEGEAD